MSTVEVRLYASLQKYFPNLKNAEAMLVTLENNASLGSLLNKLKIPREKINMIIVNGKHEKENYPLNNGDRIGLFPLIAGG
jgi:molybdopterin converting factor small subunit